MGGAFTAVHDPIHLRALVLGDGVGEVALLSLDLIEVGDMTAVRERIEREVGIPATHVLITATHSHNAPRIGLVSPGALARGGSPESLVFTETVYAAMIDALRRAKAAARPVNGSPVERGHAETAIVDGAAEMIRELLGVTPSGR